MTNEEAICVLKLKMEIHKQMFGKEVDEPLKTVYEMAIKALSAQSEWEEMLVICDNCGHAIHVKHMDAERRHDGTDT